MNDHLALAVGFVKDEPETAAAILSRLEPSIVTAFLAALPEELGPEILAGLPLPNAAACLEALPVEQSAILLQAVGYPLKIRIARAVSPDNLSRVLTAMPKSSAHQIRRDIAYVPDSVGAWMEEATSVVSEDDTVGNSLARLRRQRRPLEPTLVVVGKRRKYVGLLTLGRLLTASDKQHVKTLIDRSVAALDPDSPLTEVVKRKEWSAHFLLPVVAQRNSLLGVLRAERLRTALEQEVAWMTVPGSDLVGHLLEAALISATGMSRFFPGVEEVIEAGDMGKE